MKLVIILNDNSVINTYELTGEGSSYADLAARFTDTDGMVNFPDAFTTVEVDDDIAVDNPPLPDGCRIEYRYNFDTKEVYATSIAETHLITDRIRFYEKELERSDYKITKSYEYSLIGLDPDYNLEQLHAERQAIRNKINELETLLKSI